VTQSGQLGDISAQGSEPGYSITHLNEGCGGSRPLRGHPSGGVFHVKHCSSNTVAAARRPARGMFTDSRVTPAASLAHGIPCPWWVVPGGSSDEAESSVGVLNVLNVSRETLRPPVEAALRLGPQNRSPVSGGRRITIGRETVIATPSDLVAGLGKPAGWSLPEVPIDKARYFRNCHGSAPSSGA
jgi:hypothetical protein